LLSQWVDAPAIHVDPSKIRGAAYADEPQGRVVRLQLAAPMGDVALVMIPNVGNIEGVQPIGDGFSAGQINGNCVCWVDSGKAYFLIGGYDLSQLKSYAQSLYR
jgi:hypothetical protein